MLAETVYNVYQALPENEKARLFVMLQSDVSREEAVKATADNHYTNEECTDALMKILKKQKNENLQKQSLKVV